MILGLLTTVLSIGALIAMFWGYSTLIYVAAAISVLGLIYQNVKGGFTNPTTSILAALAGLAYAWFQGGNLLWGACLGLCWEATLIGILSYGLLIPQLIRKNKISVVYIVAYGQRKGGISCAANICRRYRLF